MSDLLELAIKAHGGWDRWQDLNRLSVHFSAGGAIWHVKGQAGVFGDAHAELDPHRPQVRYVDWPAQGQSGLYRPERTAVLARDGQPIDQRTAPRDAFAGHTLSSPWDRQQALYFAGYAMWTYLTTPFLFRLPGFRVEETEPWHENGETWRRLKVAFPASIASHCPEQTFYFNEDGVLQRHDYSVDIMGGTSSCHYVSDHRVFAGILFPTRRRVYTRAPDNKPVLDRIAVSIDIHAIDLA